MAMTYDADKAWETLAKTAGQTIYYRMVNNETGQVWNNTTKAWADAVDHIDSAIDVTEINSGDYPLIIPVELTGTGRLNIIAYIQSGSSPSEDDTVTYGVTRYFGSSFGF